MKLILKLWRIIKKINQWSVETIDEFLEKK